MARHRHVRELEREYYEEDDDDYGEYGSYEGGYSPSPGSSQYIYHQGQRKPANPIASIIEERLNERHKKGHQAAVDKAKGDKKGVITSEDYEDYEADAPVGFYEEKKKQQKNINTTKQSQSQSQSQSIPVSAKPVQSKAAPEAKSNAVQDSAPAPTRIRSESAEAAQLAAVEAIRMEKLKLANAEAAEKKDEAKKESTPVILRSSSQLFDAVPSTPKPSAAAATPAEASDAGDSATPQVSAKRAKERAALLEAEAKKDQKPRLNMVVIGHVDAGKCWAPGSKLMKPDGRSVLVEDIREGDELLGDDSQPRTVLKGSLNRGVAPMFDICPASQSGQETFRVNGNHILVLEVAQPEAQQSNGEWLCEFYSLSAANDLHLNFRSFDSASDAHKFHSSLDQKLLWEVSVRQFLAHSEILQRKCKMFRPRITDFASTGALEAALHDITGSVAPQLVDAAAWLIGAARAASLLTLPSSLLQSPEVQHRLHVWCAATGSPIVDVSSIDFAVPETQLSLGPMFSLLCDRFISGSTFCHSLITDSRSVRSHLLAGMLHINSLPSSSCTLNLSPSLISSSVADSLLFLSRSLGLSLILGPVSSLSFASAWDFSIVPLAASDYIGFSVTGPNERLLMSDFTVSHNSTLMGHVLFLKGHVSKKLMHKYEKESKEMNKSSFHFAWVLDEHEEERSRGITVDVAVNYFETATKRITLLDAPGHRDFIPNMISGAAQADAAVLVVPAVRGEFESGFVDDGQTKEHAILARALGVSQIIVAVNKLDQCDWSEERFNEILAVLIPFLKTAGFKEKDIWPIPVSGLTGENLLEKKEPKLAWYKGPALVDLIDRFSLPVRAVDKPFRMSVSDVFRGQTAGITVAGKIESGAVIPRDQLLLLPVNELVSVKSLEQRGEALSVAKAGDNVEMALKDLADNSVLSPGQWLCSPEHPIPLVTHFRAQILTLNHRIPILAGSSAVLYTQSASEPVVIHRLLQLLDKSTGGVQKTNPRALPRQSSAVVDILSKRPLCLELFSKYRELGRFTLRAGTETIAVGIVVKLFRS